MAYISPVAFRGIAQPVQAGISDDTLRQAFQKAFNRTASIFELIQPQAFGLKPIGLRHPFNFYEGHLPVFIWNKLFREVLGREPLNESFEQLFARGIDPANLEEAEAVSIHEWPERSAVQEYREQVHAHLFTFLEQRQFEPGDHPALERGALLLMLLEHELMHHETLLYMMHQLPHDLKQKPALIPPPMPAHHSPKTEMVEIPAGIALLGARPDEHDFTWDNETPATCVEVGPFAIDTYNVTNGQFLKFVEAGGYQEQEFWTPEDWQWKEQEGRQHPQFWKKTETGWHWHGFFEDFPLQLGWPAYVTQAEAAAYARFVGKSLPTEAEWHRAAYGGSPHHPYPWGNEAPDVSRGNFGFAHWNPIPVGSCLDGMSAYGVQDLIGNGWEWTCTQFCPFPGFRPMDAYPEYSMDFFDGNHYVLKGASSFTDTRLIRRSFRNWYFRHYPYMYATFRCVVRR